MAEAEVTYFTDSAALAARPAEVPAASFTNGMNLGASNAPGIGINVAGGAVDGRDSQFTLLDQDAAVREPQASQVFGGDGFVSRTGNQEFTWDETQVLYTPSGAASSGGVAGKGTDPIITGTTPTKAAKDAADPSIDGSAISTGTANLEVLANGWVQVAVVP